MCGIAGAMGQGVVDVGVVRRMASTLRHRGPDDEGLVAIRGDQAMPLAGPDTPPDARTGIFPFLPSDGAADPERVDVVLANRRLTILDLSPAGHQPICTSDRNVWVTHNGEIYNYLELRGELETLGHSFAGHSDTEVVAAAYAEWGTACFERFNGMWGTAIWDVRRRTLVLSRDRFGEKPLYYRPGANGVAFASEIKALLLDGAAAAVNEEALVGFLDTGRIDISGSRTCFAGISQVEPGSYVEWPLGGEPRTTRFYTLVPAASRGRDAEERLFELLDDAVRLRLRSDVPVGSCLSGGVDSSSIVALAQARLAGIGAPMRTYTFVAGAERLDESGFAQAVVDQTKVDASFAHEPLDLGEEIELSAREQDEPLGSGSVVAQRQVMALAHAHGTKVLLDGQGGDEVFAGYGYYRAAHLADLALSARPGAWLREFRGATTNGGEDRRWLARATGGELRRRTRREGRLLARQLDDVHLHLPALLHYEDRNSMAFSIETRLPFLDHRVVEFGLGLPGEAKIDLGWTKVALRRALAGRLPDEVLWRKDKIQFSVPQQEWLRGALRDLSGDLLGSSSFAGRPIVDVVNARALFARVDTLSEVDAGQLWRALAVELWYRAYVDPATTSPERLARVS